MSFWDEWKNGKINEQLIKQLGIDENDEKYHNERDYEYRININHRFDSLVIINRKKNRILESKEWYLYQKKKKIWVLIGSLNRAQSIELYCQTKPSHTQYLLKECQGKPSKEREEKWAQIICSVCY